MEFRAARRLAVCVPVLAAALLAPSAFAQSNNTCETGEAPDVIVGDLHEVQRYGTLNGITSFSVGTVSCNVGSCWLNWISSTNQHPVIAQNMYRLKDGRFEQIGQSWLKHGFYALSEGVCSSGCLSTDGSHLGVNCSDPYSAGLNGSQARLGPRSEVNPSTGEFPYPFSTINQTGDVLYKRLQVHNDDLDPTLNAGAVYLVEGQYVTSDDAAAGNQNNNASYREILVSGSGGVFNITLTGQTHRETPAVVGWADYDSAVKHEYVQVPKDGLFIIGVRPTSLGNGMWNYEYAIQNINSNRAAREFRVPVPKNAIVENIGFHDVDYHSGEPYDGTDWVGEHDMVGNQVVWHTDTYDDNPDANALRWGTMYSFRFDTNAAPVLLLATLGLFKPGEMPDDPTAMLANVFGPNPCNSDGICDAAETCANCPSDCVNSGPNNGVCGDGTCEPAIGEDCVSCPTDCNGQQSGNPGQRFCCGDGDGQNPVSCVDARCRTGGFACGSTTPQACCGDGTCDAGENSCICAADCGLPPLTETACTDGADEDCDGQTDCADLDCCTDGACADGIDADGDGVAECDCNDTDPSVWSTPGEAEGLVLVHDLGTMMTTLDWVPPLDPGSMSVTFDVLRAGDATRFGSVSTCLILSDATQPTATDPDIPAPGSSWSYLIRAVNSCPAGDGSLGSASGGTPRSAPSCP